MPYYFSRGFNRLFIVLTVLWAIFCGVLYPLKVQFDGQMRAVFQHDKDVKMCQQLIVERPNWDLTKNCFDRIDENQRSAMELYSFKNFWIFGVAYWQLEVFAIVAPPLVIYILTVIGRWIWRGFKPPAGGDTSRAFSIMP